MSDKSTDDRLATYERALAGFARWLATLWRPDGSLDVGSRACPAYIPLPVYAHAVGDGLVGDVAQRNSSRATSDAGSLRLAIAARELPLHGLSGSLR